MAKHERPCEAPFHVEGCDGRGSTRDHFTPRSIAKLLRWGTKRVNSPENIQWLSEACHAEKDRSTPRRLQQVRQQLNGRRLDFGDHNDE
jgi:hypothetical protein